MASPPWLHAISIMKCGRIWSLNIGDGVTQCFEIYDHLVRNMQVGVEMLSFKLTENELHTKLLHALKLEEFYAMLGYSGYSSYHYNLPSLPESITLPSIRILSNCVKSNSHQLLTILFKTSPFTMHLPSDGISMRSWDGYPLHSEIMPTGWTWVEHLNNAEPSFWMQVQLDSRSLMVVSLLLFLRRSRDTTEPSIRMESTR
ncbi:hypothetical protein K438DRAFT_719350 [Mycena galopus ATCC 62051]|nr:hypothetical protein K438DRAFT_719350 [Mycena galopus ATCC 62051]